MNPHSNYYLAINIGFPTVSDKRTSATAAWLDPRDVTASSSGCYARPTEIIEIYSLARDSFLGDRPSIPGPVPIRSA